MIIYFTRFVGGVFKARRTIVALASRQILSRYSGTLFRGIWEVAHPAVTILLYWFIFSVAFKAKGPEGVPFIVYFITGMLPWMFFADGISNGTQGIISHSFLVKKTVFKSELLPFVYLAESGLKHIVLMLIAVIVLVISGVRFSWYFIQLPYYFFVLCAFMIGLQWLLSSVNVFHRDIGQIVNIVLTVWFWATPIVWVVKGFIPPQYEWLLFINPICYIIEGYRLSLVYHKPLWNHWQQGLYVWGLLIVVVGAGAQVFRRLKPHFGDVL